MGEGLEYPADKAACLLSLPSSLPRTRPAANLGAGRALSGRIGAQGHRFPVQEPPGALIHSPSGNPGPRVTPSSGGQSPEGQSCGEIASGPISAPSPHPMVSLQPPRSASPSWCPSSLHPCTRGPAHTAPPSTGPVPTSEWRLVQFQPRLPHGIFISAEATVYCGEGAGGAADASEPKEGPSPENAQRTRIHPTFRGSGSGRPRVLHPGHLGKTPWASFEALSGDQGSLPSDRCGN